MEIATTQALFRQKAIEETSRRREIQVAYNAEQGITPTTIQKAIRAGLEAEVQAHQTARAAVTSDEKNTSWVKCSGFWRPRCSRRRRISTSSRRRSFAIASIQMRDSGEVQAIAAETSAPGMPGAPPKRKRRKGGR